MKSAFHPYIVVSSEDEEILQLAAQKGVQVHRRPARLSDDSTPLDPVIVDCFETVVKETQTEFDLVVTIQPTSPLLSAGTIDKAINYMIQNNEVETLISAKEDRHLRWTENGGHYRPIYDERVNRQNLPMEYVETGGIVISRPPLLLKKGTRIGNNVKIMVLEDKESIDIDNYLDWNLCEYILKRKTVLFVVTGNRETGLGHVYNVLGLADNILNHNLLFIGDINSKMAKEVLESHNYSVNIQTSDSIVNDIIELNPDIIINDILDTDEVYMKNLKDLGLTTINFEDLGPGSRYADVLINAIYDIETDQVNRYYGHKYFCIRDEFISAPYKVVSERVQNVLIIFGGTDPSNLTEFVIRTIYDYCINNFITINVVKGVGKPNIANIEEYPLAKIHDNCNSISTKMLEADIIFTSAGRTTFEAASIGTPTIVMAQNQRELTHNFATSKNGFLNLGLGKDVSSSELLALFSHIVHDYTFRETMSEKMPSDDIRRGKSNVVDIIQRWLQ